MVRALKQTLEASFRPKAAPALALPDDRFRARKPARCDTTSESAHRCNEVVCAPEERKKHQDRSPTSARPPSQPAHQQPLPL
jgi:hypothetical protein